MTLMLPSSSTEFARSVIQQATLGSPELQAQLLATKNWRKQYQEVYREVTRAEGSDKNVAFEIASSALKAIGEGIRDENGTSLTELVRLGAANREDVITIEIKGTGSASAVKITGHEDSLEATAALWVADRLAEPGLIAAFKYLDANPRIPIANDLLIALAGSAEFAPTEDWLRWGGKVAVVARPNQLRWAKLIATARSSAGTLVLPIRKSALSRNIAELSDEEIAALAGLDLVADTALIAGWAMQLSTKYTERIVLGNYAYAPGAKQIVAQAAQDSICALLCELIPKKRLALAWLGTPLDSFNLDAELNESNYKRYSQRGKVTKIRDGFMSAFGMVKPPTKEKNLFDATSNRQGPSYILSKRSERWRAMVADRQGFLVSFTVAPPARTRSVLSHRILEATYSGGPSFGIKPFEVDEAKSAMAALLLRNLHDENAAGIADSPKISVHGGTWRMAYLPDSVWVAATLLGFLKRG